MATASITATLNQSLGDGNFNAQGGRGGDVIGSLTTGFTDFNTFATALIAITGDTYSTTTHQFTFGGATGLTHAQWATLGALLNTAAADFNTVNSGLSGDATLTINLANVTTLNKFKAVVRAIVALVPGLGLVL